MYKYTQINPKAAIEHWGGELNEAFQFDKRDHMAAEKMRRLSLLAEVKYKTDGPINESEKRLIESYGVSTTGNILGMGPTIWGSNPGIGVGAEEGAWHKPAYEKGSGDVPTMIMGMALNVAAYAIALDMVTTIPVDVPTATFQFLDSVYAGGVMDKAGSSPIYIEVRADEIKSTFPWNTFAYGDIIFIASTNAGHTALVDGKGIQGQFVAKSFVSGRFIFKVASTGTVTATGTAYSPTNAFSINEIFEQSNIAIVKGSTIALIDGAITGITNAVPDTVSAIREHIAGFSNSDGLTKEAMPRAQTEEGTKNKINLKLWSKTTEMKGEEVIADITKVQLRDLKAYGVDGMAQLYKAAQNQLIQTINDQIIDRMYRLGVQNHAQLKSAQGVNLNLFVAPGGTASKDLANFPGIKEFVDATLTDRKAEFTAVPNSETNSSAENLYTRQRRIVSRILAASSLIGTVGRYAKGDVAVVNSQLSSAIRDVKNFTPAPFANTVGKTADLHFIGTIENIAVYENPKFAWDDTRVNVAYKGTEETPGVKFLAYDLASSVEIIAESTMAPKISILSRYAIVDAGFYPETQYLTFACANDFGSWI